MPLVVTRSEVLRLRLRSQGLTQPSHSPPPADDPVTVAVARLLALQGQDFAGVQWSIGQRAPGSRQPDVHRAFDSGALVRSWPFRGTLHVIEAENLPWVLALTGGSILARATKREHDLGIDAAALDQARRVATRELHDHGPTSRQHLLASFQRNGIETEGQRGYHLLWHLAVESTIVFGPVRGGQQLLALTDDWIRQHRRLDRDDAARETVLRYLAGRGPAGVADIAWWSGLPVRTVRTVLDDAAASLTRFEYDGTPVWASTEALDGTAALAERPVLALPGFDELLLGYSARDAMLAPEHAPLVVPTANGLFRPTVVLRGKVAGLWSRRTTSKRTSITFSPLTRPFPARAHAALRAEAAAYGRFHGVEVECEVVGTARPDDGDAV